MIYLTGSSGPSVRAVARAWGIGLLLTPRMRGARQLLAFPTWGADHGTFSQPEKFDAEPYLRWLGELRAHRSTCRFAAGPDAFGDARATVKLARPILPRIRALGYRAALVAQDGLDSGMVPWAARDVLFIGGTAEWKASPEVARLCAEARARGKRLHMGRVNSLRRLRLARDLGCASADGTFLRFGPAVNLPRLKTWLDRIEAA